MAQVFIVGGRGFKGIEVDDLKKLFKELSDDLEESEKSFAEALDELKEEAKKAMGESTCSGPIYVIKNEPKRAKKGKTMKNWQKNKFYN